MSAKRPLEQQENLNDLAIRNMVSRISIGEPSQPETDKMDRHSQ